MTNSLDFTTTQFRAFLTKTAELVLKQFENLEARNGYHYFPQKEVESWFDEPVPTEGMPLDDLLQFVEEKVLKTATGNLGPNMYGYVMSGGNQVSILADQLTATINQNVAKWHLSPSLTEIDKRLINWAASMIGYGEEVGGFIGSSGSSANLDGLTVARNIFFEKLDIRKKGLFQCKPFVLYCSDETHSSVDKSVQLLGIGTDNLRRIPTNVDFTINLELLEQQIQADIQKDLQPFCLIGNAGTVNTGAIDDLTALSKIAKKYQLWLHVDGAYGGLAASLDTKKALYKGIELADSVALDFHKWLYQPFEIGCLLVKDWAYMKRTYFKPASYLDKSLEQDHGRLEFNEHHFMLSRSGKSLKAWMTLKAYGIKRIKAMIQKDIDLADYLSNQVRKADDFELVANSDLAISCFRYKGNLMDKAAITELNKKLVPALEKDGRVFITSTVLKGEFVFRACLTNHRKTKKSTDFLLDVIREVGRKLEIEN